MTDSANGEYMPVSHWPIPPTISAEAQRVLDDSAAMSMPQAPADSDENAWRDFIAMMREGVRGSLEAGAARAYGTVALSTEASSGVPIHVAAPHCREGAATTGEAPVLLYVHGGGFVLGGGQACQDMGMLVAHGTGLAAYSVDYRLAPEHPYPAAMDDCMAAYRWLVERLGAGSVVVAGHSAGAALAGCLLLRARDEGLPAPLGAVLLSPEADLAEEGDSTRSSSWGASST